MIEWVRMLLQNYTGVIALGSALGGAYLWWRQNVHFHHQRRLHEANEGRIRALELKAKG